MACNFRCTYCFNPPSIRNAEPALHGANDQWEEGFDATGKTWLIHTTGGEPFGISGFVALCERLTRRHFLSINSNLSYRSADDFAQSIHPGRVHYIHASLHYEEQQRRASLDAFMARVHKLRDAQFNVLVSQVMTPQMVDNFPAVSACLESHGLSVIPKILRGRFGGKNYPDGYTADHRARIREYLAAARLKYAAVIERMKEPPTIHMFSDSHLLNGIGSYHGKRCGSGYNFVRIAPDGTVYRCGSGKRLGNLLLKNVRLLNGPKRCNASYCPYFCEKYTSPQFLSEQSSLRMRAGRASGKAACLRIAGVCRSMPSLLRRIARSFITR